MNEYIKYYLKSNIVYCKGFYNEKKLKEGNWFYYRANGTIRCSKFYKKGKCKIWNVYSDKEILIDKKYYI